MFTRWPEAFAVSSADKDTTASLLVEQIICRFGAPKELLSDRGKNFLSDLVVSVAKILQTHKQNTTAYRPQTNGLCERFNQTFATMISMYVSGHHRDWDALIPFLLFAYSSSIHESTMESPFFLVYGRDPRLPIDIALDKEYDTYLDTNDYRADVVSRLEAAISLVRDNVQLAQQKRKQYFDLKTKHRTFDVGERIWLFTPQKRKRKSTKLLYFWHGPFRIVEQTSPVNYRITSSDERRRTFVVHVNRLKTYVDPADQPWRVAEPPHEEDPNAELEDLWEADDDLPLAELSKHWNIAEPDSDEDFDIT